MNKTLHILFVVILLTETILINGCCWSCGVYATSIEKVSSDDELLFYEYSVYSEWYEGASCEDCRIDRLEFWLENMAWRWYEENTKQPVRRPECLPYEIISRKEIKPKELFKNLKIVYEVQVKTEDIMKSIEEAR